MGKTGLTKTGAEAANPNNEPSMTEKIQKGTKGIPGQDTSG